MKQQVIIKKICVKCRKEFEFSKYDAGPWEDYCYKCERELDKFTPKYEDDDNE